MSGKNEREENLGRGKKGRNASNKLGTRVGKAGLNEHGQPTVVVSNRRGRVTGSYGRAGR